MKNKILMAGILAMTFALVGSAYAVGQNNNRGTGMGNQIQAGTSAGTGAGTQTQQQTQQKLQDGTGTGNQIQNQNQVKNQSEANQIQNSEQQRTQTGNKSGSAVAEQRRSEVANAVQEMLRMADRNGGIGQQVRIIAQNQNQNQEKIETSLQKVQDRKGFAKFFVGPNYGEISNAKRILEQNREQIKQLKQIKNQLANQSEQQTLTEQIKTLEQASLEIENSLGTMQKGFSLFGWIFRMFSN